MCPSFPMLLSKGKGVMWSIHVFYPQCSPIVLFSYLFSTLHSPRDLSPCARESCHFFARNTLIYLLLCFELRLLSQPLLSLTIPQHQWHQRPFLPRFLETQFNTPFIVCSILSPGVYQFLALHWEILESKTASPGPLPLWCMLMCQTL